MVCFSTVVEKLLKSIIRSKSTDSICSWIFQLKFGLQQIRLFWPNFAPLWKRNKKSKRKPVMLFAFWNSRKEGVVHLRVWFNQKVLWGCGEERSTRHFCVCSRDIIVKPSCYLGSCKCLEKSPRLPDTKTWWQILCHEQQPICNQHDGFYRETIWLQQQHNVLVPRLFWQQQQQRSVYGGKIMAK